MKLLVFFILAISTAVANDCGFDALNARNCHFYNDCVEQKIPCGEKGYALGYGEHYCRRFNETFDVHRDEFSVAAHKWRISTARCLQREIGKTVEALLQAPVYNQCKVIKKNAFAQHAGCYTQTSNSICFLPPTDIMGIFRHKIIGFSDMFLSFSAISQILEVKRICLEQLKNAPRDERFHAWKYNFKDLTNSY